MEFSISITVLLLEVGRPLVVESVKYAISLASHPLFSRHGIFPCVYFIKVC